MIANQAVFLSYASEDTDAARRICDALRQADITVWFDQSELRGGDAWDSAIRKQIKACALFVPIISANTRARVEAYFRFEWKLAIDRSHLMADERKFLLPVVIDATSQSDARVPERFREVQWTRLPAGEVPGAFVQQISRLLSFGDQTPSQERHRGGRQLPIRFGNVEVQPMTRQVLIDGAPAPIGARAFDLLATLIEHRDRLVTKGELLDLVWSGLVVEENNLQVQISALRKLFGPNVIATIPGRGYRFVAVLEGVEPSRVPTPGPSDVQVRNAETPAREPRHTLPAERDAFVGRSDALSELGRRFDEGARMVSLLGIGGTGKTRLATRFGWTRAPEFPGGVWFCDLAPARTVEGVLNAVASGLDVALGRDDPVTQLGDAIAGRAACLVILDNFEQVARHAGETLGCWLERAPLGRFLVTTRVVLGIAGEQVQALAPLSVAEAEALFVRRAAAAGRNFEAAPEECNAIAPLVKLLDGLPLAIELAAARARTLAPRALLQRISDRFRLLASAGGRIERQATLRAAFDWSWELLTPAEKLAFAQCSVFEGGFTLEAAEAVIDLSSVADAPWVVDVVQSLVDKSLVRLGSDARFEMLVSVQAYAGEHLQAEGSFPGSGPRALRAARRRHGEWFAQFGAEPAVKTRGIEIHNLVAACRHNIAEDDAETAVGALEGAWAALMLQGPFKAGVDLAEAVSAMPGVRGAAQARALTVLGDALGASGRPAQAQMHYEAALAQALAADEPRAAARVTVKLATLMARAGRPDEARAAHGRALELARQLGDADLECAALNGLGVIAMDQGRNEEARVHYERALQIAHGCSDRRLHGSVLGNLGNLHLAIGQRDAAARMFEATLQVGRELRDRVHEGNSLCNLGMLQYLQGRYEGARDSLDAALTLAREMGYARLECVVLCNLGMVHRAAGLLAQAISCYEGALGVARRIGDRRTEGQVLGYLGQAHARLNAIAQARDCLDRGQALLVELSDRISLGVLLCGRAECELLAGDVDKARAARDMAAEIATEATAGADSELGIALAQVEQLLGELAF